MNEAIQHAIELAREGKTQEAYEIIEQEIILNPNNGLAWAIRAQLVTGEVDRLDSLTRASEHATSELKLAWIRREIERIEKSQQVSDPFPGDPTTSSHAFDMAFLEDDIDHSMQTQAIDVAEQKPRRRGCLTLLTASVVLGIVTLAASIFLVPTLQQMIPSLNLPTGAGRAEVAEEPAATEIPGATPTTLPPTPAPPTPVDLPADVPRPLLTNLVPPEDDGSENGFGRSVAINRNEIVVIGSPGADLENADNDTRTRRGAVYIYQYNPANGQWEVQKVLTPPEDLEGFHFGISVAIDDQNTIAVGWESGAVSIYQPTETGPGLGDWFHQQTIGGDRAGFGFGTSVAIDGDLLAVGWPNYRGINGDILYAGAVYVYRRASNNAWEPQTVLTLDKPDEYDQFGASVAVDSNTIVVGMLGRNDLENGWGGVYVFQQEGSGWVKRASFTQPDDVSFTIFGQAVDIDGSLIVSGTFFGSAPEPGSPARPGAAFIIEDLSSQGDWSDVVETRFNNPNPAPEASFGIDVAVDGQSVAVSEMIVVPTELGYARGLIYRFTQGADQSWILADTFEASGIEDRYGIGVSIDVSGDMVIVGAPRSGSAPDGSLPETAFLFEAPIDTSP